MGRRCCARYAEKSRVVRQCARGFRRLSCRVVERDLCSGEIGVADRIQARCVICIRDDVDDDPGDRGFRAGDVRAGLTGTAGSILGWNPASSSEEGRVSLNIHPTQAKLCVIMGLDYCDPLALKARFSQH